MWFVSRFLVAWRFRRVRALSVFQVKMAMMQEGSMMCGFQPDMGKPTCKRECFAYLCLLVESICHTPELVQTPKHLGGGGCFSLLQKKTWLCVGFLVQMFVGFCGFCAPVGMCAYDTTTACA